MNQHDDAFDDDIEFVSKSEVKREMHKLQALGERLLTLKASDIKDFPLSDVMLLAVAENARIKSHEAQRRHLQYIGKLMRDEDLEGIQHCFDKLDPSSEYYLRIQNQAEAWRLRLIQQDQAEGDWFDQYPNTERQEFRSIVRAARKEQPEDSENIKAGKNTKKLLQWIKKELLN